jgi:hypothetical protein
MADLLQENVTVKKILTRNPARAGPSPARFPKIGLFLL